MAGSSISKPASRCSHLGMSVWSAMMCGSVPLPSTTSKLRRAVSTSAPRASSRLLRDIVTSDARRQEYLASGAWDASTLVGRVCAHARTKPDSIAVVDLLGMRRRTYAELEQDALRVASFLIESGVEPGDVVAVQLPNRYETVAIALGIL